MSSIISKEKMEEIVKSSFSIAECLRKMGRSDIGGNYRTFYRYKGLYNLDTSHFTGQRVRKNSYNETQKPVEFYLHKDCYTSIKSSKLLKKLVDAGYKLYECERCHMSEWFGEPITLQLHHIDGDHFNNELDNLKILCPNCHSQTDNFCGKNHKKEVKKIYCKECGKQISRYSKSGLCKNCVDKQQRITDRPDKETLHQMLIETNFSIVAKKYNVSDNAVRKWCRQYGLSDKSKDYKMLP